MHIQFLPTSRRCRFGTTFLGSSAVAGTLVGSDRLLSRDGDGLTVGDVLKQHGLDASDASLEKLAYTSSQVRLLWLLHLGRGGMVTCCGGGRGRAAWCMCTAGM